MLLANLADCYYTGGLPDRAAKVYDELINCFEEGSFEHNFFFGLSQLCRKDFAAAAISFRAAVALNPANDAAKKALTKVEAILKNPRK